MIDAKPNEICCLQCGTRLDPKHVNRDMGLYWRPVCLTFFSYPEEGPPAFLESSPSIKALMAEKCRSIPKGMREERDRRGNLTIRIRRNWRRKLATIFLALPVGIAVMAGIFLVEPLRDQSWLPVTAMLITLDFGLVILLPIAALAALTERRFTLTKTCLRIRNNWLGLIPVWIRQLPRTSQSFAAITISQSYVLGAKRDLIIEWRTGSHFRSIWRDTDKSADAAMSLWALLNRTIGWPDAIPGEPFRCVCCGKPFPPEAIDIRGGTLTCPACGKAVTISDAANGHNMLQIVAQDTPDEVETIANGFIYREGRLWNTSAKRIARLGVFAMIVIGIVSSILDRCPLSEPFEHALALFFGGIAIAWALVLIVVMVWGRFAIHRMIYDEGNAVYFTGIGSFGKTVTFRPDLNVQMYYNRFLLLSGIRVTRDAQAKGQGGTALIFRMIPPRDYTWIVSWMTLRGHAYHDVTAHSPPTVEG